MKVTAYADATNDTGTGTFDPVTEMVPEEGVGSNRVPYTATSGMEYVYFPFGSTKTMDAFVDDSTVEFTLTDQLVPAGSPDIANVKKKCDVTAENVMFTLAAEPFTVTIPDAGVARYPEMAAIV